MISTPSGGLRRNGCTYGTDRQRTARFVAAGSGTDFEEGVTFVIRSFGSNRTCNCCSSCSLFSLVRAVHPAPSHAFQDRQASSVGFDIFLNLLPVGKTARNITYCAYSRDNARKRSWSAIVCAYPATPELLHGVHAGLPVWQRRRLHRRKCTL